MNLIPDPTRITNFDQSELQLEYSLVFWVLVAGKTARVVARQMESLVPSLFQGACLEPQDSLFEALKRHDLESIQSKLKQAGIGCWKLKGEALHQLSWAGLDLGTCSVQELEAIRGIGPKTARCFVLHSRRDARVAGLDTHILRYLRGLGFEAPKTTPGSKSSYSKWEKVVLDLAVQQGVDPAEFDLWIWNQLSRKPSASRVIQNV